MSYLDDERIKKELDDEYKEKEKHWARKKKQRSGYNPNDVDGFEMDAYGSIDGGQH